MRLLLVKWTVQWAGSAVQCASSAVQWANLRDVIVKLEAATVVGIEERREDKHHSVSIGFKIVAGWRNCFKRSSNGREEN
jgi:hypothetical protein